MYKIFSSLLGTEKKEKEKKTNKNSIKIHSESNNNEDLNEECKTKINEIILTDKEIDKGLDAIDNALDNCMKMAKDMKEEMLSQNRKLDTMNNSISKTTDRQTIITKRVEVINRYQK